MMKRRLLLIGIFLATCLVISGCSWEAFNRKFVRKKKGQKASSAVYQPQLFVKPSNAEIYEHAFLFWRTWEDELLAALSPSGYPRTVNELKIKECLDEAVVNLSEMKKCLNDDKAQELAAHIRGLQEIQALLDKQQDLSGVLLDKTRHDVEAHKRNVEIRFSAQAVAKDIQE